MGYTVAVVGATGAVGAQMIKMLEESTLPIDKIRYLASARSAGKVLQFKGQDVTIEETTEDATSMLHNIPDASAVVKSRLHLPSATLIVYAPSIPDE